MSKPVEPDYTSSFEYKYLFERYQSAIEELKAAIAELQAIGKDNCYDCACKAPAQNAVARIDKFLKEIE